MLKKIKNKVERELSNYIRNNVNSFYSLHEISPLLYKSIKDFVSRAGKRIRPTLFVIGYLGFAKKEPYGLYKSAIALELFHDFMLIHDDIIDKSDTRRGKPSMHAMFDKWLSGYRNPKVSGQDLAIATGDIIYAMAIDAFLSVRENMHNKEMALKRLVQAGVYTGSGEFIELICSLKNIGKISMEDIYRVYDLKTANYTFASPLSMGAILAGAPKREVDLLFRYGIYLGRAFQIKDDILGTFGKESEIGKSNLTDLKEGKKTILIWLAYRNAQKKDRLIIEDIFNKKSANLIDLAKIRRIIVDSGALNSAKKEVNNLTIKAKSLLETSGIKPKYRTLLNNYTHELLGL